MRSSHYVGRGAQVLAIFCAFALIMPSAAATDNNTFNAFLANGVLKNSQDTIRVKKGEKIIIRWTSDSAMEVHLHGYDIISTVKPGAISNMVVNATVAGRFAINGHGAAADDHHSSGAGELKLDHGEHAVMYLEVLP